MKYLLGVILLFSGIQAVHSQQRYRDALFSKIDKRTFTYADTLQLDFYSAATDTLSARPLLLLVHGGGFSIGKRDNPLETAFCRDMAGRGYAVASISYRLTRVGKSFGCDCPALEKERTFVAATEDILNATSFLRNKSEVLGFDRDKIILVGSSAGAEAVLNTAFMGYHWDFKGLPYEEIKYAGIVSFAGAVMDVDYLLPENAVPALLFHGEKDSLVPFGAAAHHYCDAEAAGFLLLDGSGAIAEKLRNLHTSYQLMYDPDGNHDWANEAYECTDIVAKFVKEVILEKKQIQSKIRIESNTDEN